LVIDRSATDARVQIEIPAKCDAIRGLLKAVDQGLKVKSPASRPVVTHDRTCHVPDRRLLPRDGYEVMEVATRRREEVRVGWVVVKQVAHGEGEIFYLNGGSEVD
jgi:hypothetical protein